MKGQRFQQLLTIGLLICGLCSIAVPAQTKKDVSQAKDLVGQGDQAYNQKNFKDALDKYTQAIQLVSNNPEEAFQESRYLLQAK